MTACAAVFDPPELTREHASKEIAAAPEFNQYATLLGVSATRTNRSKDSLPDNAEAQFEFQQNGSGLRIKGHATFFFDQEAGRWRLSEFQYGDLANTRSVSVYTGPMIPELTREKAAELIGAKPEFNQYATIEVVTEMTPGSADRKDWILADFTFRQKGSDALIQGRAGFTYLTNIWQINTFVYRTPPNVKFVNFPLKGLPAGHPMYSPK